MARSVSECQLVLSGATVLTEAATGAYAVTPVLAALGGAKRVYAFTRKTRYGTVREVAAQTSELAAAAKVTDRICIVDQVSPEMIYSADIVTNSGHLRPIDAEFIDGLNSRAVISLMFEAWELPTRPDDVDVQAANRRKLRIAGTNERHPNVDVFSYLAHMAARGLFEAGVAVYRSRVGLLCDNSFADFIRAGLERFGAEVHVATSPMGLSDVDLDAIVVALLPRDADVIGHREAKALAGRSPGVHLVQMWGDVDRRSLKREGLSVFPATEPAKGHMGILPSEIGAEPIVRLQTGGLKVAQVLMLDDPSPTESAYVDYL